jgi:hypothetical protein
VLHGPVSGVWHPFLWEQPPLGQHEEQDEPGQHDQDREHDVEDQDAQRARRRRPGARQRIIPVG